MMSLSMRKLLPQTYQPLKSGSEPGPSRSTLVWMYSPCMENGPNTTAASAPSYEHPVMEHSQSAPDCRQKKADKLPAEYGSLTGKYSKHTAFACGLFIRHLRCHALM